jgi:hypothetical protein
MICKLFNRTKLLLVWTFFIRIYQNIKFIFRAENLVKVSNHIFWWEKILNGLKHIFFVIRLHFGTNNFRAIKKIKSQNS